jgi:SAM-dependent methyltransferase
MSTTDTLCGWGEHDRVTYYLNNVNILIPKRQEQLTMLVDLLGGLPQGVQRVLDLGSGFGAITQAILTHYPEASITCVDGSAEMLALAQERLQKEGARVELLLGDLAFPSWREAVRGPFDAVVSGLAIHHLLNRTKRDWHSDAHADRSRVVRLLQRSARSYCAETPDSRDSLCRASPHAGRITPSPVWVPVGAPPLAPVRRRADAQRSGHRALLFTLQRVSDRPGVPGRDTTL